MVRVEAPGRLHLGFLDPSATIGRRYGSVGVTLDGPSTVIEMAVAPEDRFELDAEASSADARADLARVRRHVDVLRRIWGHAAPLAVTLRRALPAHAGFGSGTQLALATGRAYAELFGIERDTRDAARALERGLRSGVGIAAFDEGGFIVDGGRSDGDALPPVVSRLDFPAAWRIVLVRHAGDHGLHGDAERDALAALPPFDASLSAELCHRLLMQVLPGVADADFAAFADGVNRIQDANGAYFAPAQGGDAYVSPAVGGFLRAVRRSYAAAVGQSSWGPTGYACVPSQAEADAIVAGGIARGLPAEIVLSVVAASNRGARIEVDRDTRAELGARRGRAVAAGRRAAAHGRAFPTDRR